MGTARARLRRCGLTPSQRAALRRAQEHVDRIFRDGMTPEKMMQARAEIDALDPRRRHQLSLPLPS
jgi:hypothetical protein